MFKLIDRKPINLNWFDLFKKRTTWEDHVLRTWQSMERGNDGQKSWKDHGGVETGKNQFSTHKKNRQNTEGENNSTHHGQKICKNSLQSLSILVFNHSSRFFKFSRFF